MSARLIGILLLGLLIVFACDQKPAVVVATPMEVESATPEQPVVLPDHPLTGKQLFIACVGCHSLAAGADHKVGPNLFGLRGKVAGTQAGYRYSSAMIEAGNSGLVWDEDSLLGFIIMTEDMVPGTWMLYYDTLQGDEVSRLISYILGELPDDSLMTPR